MVTARAVRPSAATGANEEEATSERGQHGWHVHPSMSHDLYQIRRRQRRQQRWQIPLKWNKWTGYRCNQEFYAQLQLSLQMKFQSQRRQSCLIIISIAS